MGIGRAVFDGRVVREEFALALGSEIVTHRAYQRPGSGNVAVGPGQWSALYADGRFGGDAAGRAVVSRGDGVGRPLRSRLPRAYDDTDAPGLPRADRGAGGLMLGLGSSFDYRLRDLPRMHDRIASLGMGGPMFEFSARARCARARVVLAPVRFRDRRVDGVSCRV